MNINKDILCNIERLSFKLCYNHLFILKDEILTSIIVDKKIMIMLILYNIVVWQKFTKLTSILICGNIDF
jgi:hypothetical protein